MIYLDNAATTQVAPWLKDTIDKYLYEDYGNAGSPHRFGLNAKSAIHKAREQIATATRSNPNEVFFAGTCTEANNIAILGIADYLKSIGKTHIITCQWEHESVLNPCKVLESRGFRVSYLPPTNLSAKNIFAHFTNETGLVSLMEVNNEVSDGISDLEDIAKVCHDNGVLIHSDVTQSFGDNEFEFWSKGIADMITFAGHKIHAPKGIGCLVTKVSDKLSPQVFGGGQERGLRSGTENVASIAALGKRAEELTTPFYADKEWDKTLESCEVFLETLEIECNKRGVLFNLNGSCGYRNRKIKSITFDGVDAETLVSRLSAKGVCVSAGSACSSNSQEPSHVLLSIGLSPEQARSTIRVSFSCFNTPEESRKAAKIIAETVTELKEVFE